MADVRAQFKTFHDNIRSPDNEKKQKKRDMLVSELRENLSSSRPGFKEFNQGSYAMHTNIVPIHGNDDLDVGLRFQDVASGIGCPVKLKEDIKEALMRPNRTVRIRRPCVTVQYFKDSKPDYHIDLAVYALTEAQNDRLELAIGRSGGAVESRQWSEQDPLGVIRTVADSYPIDSEERRQFRRCIRYLKRWRDECFGAETGPISIVLTTAAKRWFEPKLGVFDNQPRDLIAMCSWVDTLIEQFQLVKSGGTHRYRIQVDQLCHPYSDLMASSGDNEHEQFKNQLECLKGALDDAERDIDTHSACSTLQKKFGKDFPVPPKSATAKRVAPAVVTTGSSA